MKNSRKIKNTIRFLIGITLGIIVSAIGVYAATKYDASDVYYDNSNSSLMNIDVQGAVDELADKYKSISKSSTGTCPNGYICLDKKTSLALGDYVKMTPTKSSYTTDKSKTGYTSTQTINPQELNLWRVISINNDGTVDVISEHVSSTTIRFKGQTGYLNLVGYLNVLAKQYENSTYTKGSRAFGYNGQTEYITDTSKFTNPAPWTCSTGESCNPVESQGGGDKLYTKDYNLVKSVLGTAIASKPDGISYDYWMASRYYIYSSAALYLWSGQIVSSLGDEANNYLYSYSSSSFDSNYGYNSLRPILTLKSGLKYSGMGTEDYPMEIQGS